MHRKLIAALALALAGIAGSATAQTVVSGAITTNTTWSGTIVLDGAVFVKQPVDGLGNPTGPVPTLTISAGTIVRGQPRTAATVSGSVVGQPGALFVTRSGRIVVNGNALSPVIFTTAATDNNGDNVPDDADVNGFKDTWEPGDVFYDDTPATNPLSPLDQTGAANVALWGGVAVLGNAPVNLANISGVGYGLGLIEGCTVPGYPPADCTYGGLEAHDNSGRIRFASIRHAGDEIANSNELNGLSLAGVGDGTVVENVEVYCNFDDGFEWFGGTVGGKRLHVAFAGDDSFDTDEGHHGVAQFLFAVMPYFNTNLTTGAPPVPVPFGSASGDKGTEFDGDNYRVDAPAPNDNVNTRINILNTVVDATPWPFSAANWYNMTIIGSTPDAPLATAPVSAASANRGIQTRNGFAGNIFNSIVVNTGTAQGFEVDAGATAAPGFNASQNATAGLLNLVCSTLDDVPAVSATTQTAITNGNAFNLAMGGTAAGNNTVNSPGFPGLVTEDQTFPLQGTAGDGKLGAIAKNPKLNPRPASGGFAGLVGCTDIPAPGITATSYRGAFEQPASVPLWTTDWTALNIGGILAD